MHAWDCRTCNTRNAPSLAFCRQCGAWATNGRVVSAQVGPAPRWKPSRSLLFSLLGPPALVLVVMGLGAPSPLFIALAAIWLLVRIALDVRRMADR